MDARCPKCNEFSSVIKWNKATEDDFSGTVPPGIKKIGEEDWERCYYTCPMCNTTSTGQELENANISRNARGFEF